MKRITREENIKEAEELIKQDKYQDALAKYSLIWKETPEDEELLKKMMFLYSRIHEGNLDFQPTTYETYMFRGISRFWEKDFDGSIKDLDEAIKLDPKNDYAYKSRAFSKFYSGNAKGAFDDINMAISIQPIGDYIDNKAMFYSQTGDKKNALNWYKRAVETEPDNARLWYNYGVELGENGNAKAALEMFNKAIELWPQYPDALENRNYILENRLHERE